MKALKSTSAASAADPIAYPLVTALVVLPTASRGSVMSRTSCGQVGHLGDPARVVGDRPERVEGHDQSGQRELRHDGDADSVDPAVPPPASFQAPRIARRSRAPAAAVDWKPCASPWMMLVAWPVSEARAIVFTGRKRVEV